jgi:hypothetical protein
MNQIRNEIGAALELDLNVFSCLDDAMLQRGETIENHDAPAQKPEPYICATRIRRRRDGELLRVWFQ